MHVFGTEGCCVSPMSCDSTDHCEVRYSVPGMSSFMNGTLHVFPKPISGFHKPFFPDPEESQRAFPGHSAPGGELTSPEPRFKPTHSPSGVWASVSSCLLSGGWCLCLSRLTCSCPRPGAGAAAVSQPDRHSSLHHSLQVGASVEEPWCQRISSCSYITLVISGGSLWTFAQNSLQRQEKGYKTLGPVSRCHLGENLSGLQVPSDWIIMNNE